MTVSLSWNCFVTKDNEALYGCIIMTFYGLNHKIATLTRIGKRYFIGRNFNSAGSFEDDLLAMPVRPSRRLEEGCPFLCHDTKALAKAKGDRAFLSPRDKYSCISSTEKYVICVM